MLPVYFFVVLLASSSPGTYAYVDFGVETFLSASVFDQTARPHQLPTDLRQELLPSMITAVSPSITLASNGTRETVYSLHYHKFFQRTRQGRGIFKRGVFANDPPISTCKPCGGSGDATSTSSTTTSPCVTKTYHVGCEGPSLFQIADYSCRGSSNILILKPQLVTVMIQTMEVFSNLVPTPIPAYPVASLSQNPA